MGVLGLEDSNVVSGNENETTPKVSTEAMPPLEIHKVCLPQKKTTCEKLKHRLCEIFFPDDPFHRFKNQTFFRKLVLGLQYFFPILQWGPNYSISLLRCDVVSGLTIASLAIPQGISYARLGNLPPVIGLYSSFVPPLIYSILGTSRHLSPGPVSIASLVMGTMISKTVSQSEEPILYLKLTFTATFFAGLVQASLSFLRLGFIIDFLSKATLVGFTAGAAVIIFLQQLKGLLGISHFTTKMQIIPVLSRVFHDTKECSGPGRLIMSCSFLLFLLLTRKISMKNSKLFWISAAAPMTSVILSTILLFILKSHVHEISTVGNLPSGVNPLSVNELYLHGPHLVVDIKTGIITGILSLTDGIVVGRTFASQNDYQIDGNKEMMAIGLMNAAGSCFSCYITTGSFSRSAVYCNAGGKTAASNIIMALAVLLTMLFLTPLFYYTPNAILAVIIITAVIGRIDYQVAYQLWKIDKLDFFTCLCSFFGVLFISVPMGLVIAIDWIMTIIKVYMVDTWIIVLSVFKILLHITRPNIVVLGKILETQIYQDLCRYKEATRVPSFLILGFQSPVYFANSIHLQERILRWVRDEDERIQANNESKMKCIILDMTAVTAIDTSGIEAIRQLRKTLENRSHQLVLVNPVGSVMEKLQKSKILESFGSNGLYLTVGEAVTNLTSLQKAQP